MNDNSQWWDAHFCLLITNFYDLSDCLTIVAFKKPSENVKFHFKTWSWCTFVFNVCNLRCKLGCFSSLLVSFIYKNTAPANKGKHRILLLRDKYTKPNSNSNNSHAVNKQKNTTTCRQLHNDRKVLFCCKTFISFF